MSVLLVESFKQWEHTGSTSTGSRGDDDDDHDERSGGWTEPETPPSAGFGLLWARLKKTSHVNDFISQVFQKATVSPS
ncbi:uncharacterized [Tachysurus ichikawai]